MGSLPDRVDAPIVTDVMENMTIVMCVIALCGGIWQLLPRINLVEPFTLRLEVNLRQVLLDEVEGFL
jgi:hypothetical protein